MILHIPHASIDTLGYEFLTNIKTEITLLTDHSTDELFKCSGAKTIIFPVSRLICDVERFEQDAQEPMSKVGMGVCYTHTSDGKPLRSVTMEQRQHIVENYYKPHHKRLFDLVNEELKVNGKSLIIDCHSFPAQPLPCDQNQTTPRPDICIGTDDFHTPNTLIELVVQAFGNLGYSVQLNTPYEGTMVPIEYYGYENNVHSIMIEVNRDLYKTGLTPLRENISSVLKMLIDSYEL